MGTYKYAFPVENQEAPEISISLLSDKHKVLKPLDGDIQVDPTCNEMFIEFVVINMAEETQAFKQKIVGLEQQVNSLKSKNELSKQQLSKLYNTLVDTVLHFEAIRTSMEYQMDHLQDMTEEQRSLIQQQQLRIDSLEEKVYGLSIELTTALEKKYLRQNQYFKAMSENFSKYIRAANDVTEHLGFIKTYFNSGDFRSLDRDLRLYEEAFVAISDSHQEQLSGVDRYWGNPQLTKELESIFDLLIKGMHLNQLRPTLNDVIDQIQKQKPGKAQKMATEATEDIVFNLRDLEKRINRVLIQLRNS